MYKTLHVRTTVWSWDVEKWGSQLASQLARKIVRRCAENHIFKWKCTKHCMFGPLFEVEMCTPLWREARVQVKMYKTRHVRTTFCCCDVEKLDLYAAVARSAFPSQNVKNWRSRSTFWSWDVEKLHGAVARSTFVSQTVQNTCVLPHFVKFRCQ